ncbi:hypothetical protein GR7B_00119 [Vibrio phage vB_VcorM_GR7B]|nr:hypothetical protein GR7B_00119 [Vibrio phage vB_VcorM_GR7B]
MTVNSSETVIDKEDRHIDLSQMPSGGRYEDRYGSYLDIFKVVAESSEPWTVTRPPASWVPLLNYLGADCSTPQVHFEHDEQVSRLLNVDKSTQFCRYPFLDRTSIEVVCGFRPELVDALWKSDMQWETKLPQLTKNLQHERKEFIITNNGSFHRKEVLDYFETLDDYTPTKRNLVLVPCAPDKPYPAPMHSAVIDCLEATGCSSDTYIANATGVLGIVPQDLWAIMPHYDSGIPYEWRLKKTFVDYFSKHEHDTIVVYCDFYNLAIKAAFDELTHNNLWAGGIIPQVKFVNEVKFYSDYLNLSSTSLICSLRNALLEIREEDEEDEEDDLSHIEQ